MASRPTSIVVTGAAGFAGSHLLDLLAHDGAAVTAWHRPGGTPPPRSEQRSEEGSDPKPGGVRVGSDPDDGAYNPEAVTWEAVDLLDRAAVRTALERARPAAVYHCAGAAHVGRSWDKTESTFAINVRGTHHVIEGLRDIGLATRVVVPSSAMVYAARNEPLHEDHPLAPASPYALSKLAQEMVGQGDPGGPDVLIARAFNHFGPRQDPWFVASGFARRIADIEGGRWAPEIAVGNLESRRDLTDVRDTVRAYQVIAERGTPGRAYNVCTGRAMAVRDLLDMLLARARVPIQIKIDPARYRPNDQPLVVGNPGRIHDELGWTPRIPIERTVDDLLQYWRSR